MSLMEQRLQVITYNPINNNNLHAITIAYSGLYAIKLRRYISANRYNTLSNNSE